MPHSTNEFDHCRELLASILKALTTLASLIERSCALDPGALETLQQLTRRDCNIINVLGLLSTILSKVLPIIQKMDASQSVSNTEVEDYRQELTTNEIYILQDFINNRATRSTASSFKKTQ